MDTFGLLQVKRQGRTCSDYPADRLTHKFTWQLHATIKQSDSSKKRWVPTKKVAIMDKKCGVSNIYHMQLFNLEIVKKYLLLS